MKIYANMPSNPVSFPHPWRLRAIVPPLLILPTIGLLLSGVITWINVGFDANFTAQWMRGFVSALPVMLVAFAFMAVLDRKVQQVFAGQSALARKLILAGCTACMMELLLASAVTLSNRGLAAGFVSAWGAAFLKSLPVGLCVSLFMGFVIKPRLDRLAASQ
jgi:FtsH-binding integral membrane protein